MSTTSAVALGVTVALAGLGYVATYLNNLRLAMRRDALDRVNGQLRDFYGPLITLLSASRLLFERFHEMEFTEPDVWTGVDEQQKDQYRTWMTNAMMPLNRRMVTIIVTHAHLVDEDHMPPELLTLCAHVSGYESLMKEWERGNHDRMVPYILFPNVVGDYVERSFRRLKKRQARLLGGARHGSDAARPTTLEQFRLSYPECFRDAYVEPNRALVRARRDRQAALDQLTAT